MGRPITPIPEGTRRGRLTVAEPRRPGDGKLVKVRCDCGTVKRVNASHFLHQTIRSCGCLHREQAAVNMRANQRDNIAGNRQDRPPEPLPAGTRFGRLTVTHDRDGASRVIGVLCDCGTAFAASVKVLRRGDVRSCGCLRREVAAERSTTHGGTGSREYTTWKAMWQRCTNPRASKYRYYGGRGITVCARWRDFEAFLADMGPRPAGKSIDRVDPDGDYEPGNCRWATQREQVANRRRSLH